MKLIRGTWRYLAQRVRGCWACGHVKPLHYGWCHKVWSDSGWN